MLNLSINYYQPAEAFHFNYLLTAPVKDGAGHFIVIILKSYPNSAIIVFNIAYYIGYHKRILRNAIKGTLRASMTIYLFCLIYFEKYPLKRRIF